MPERRPQLNQIDCSTMRVHDCDSTPTTPCPPSPSISLPSLGPSVVSSPACWPRPSPRRVVGGGGGGGSSTFGATSACEIGGEASAGGTGVVERRAEATVATRRMTAVHVRPLDMRLSPRSASCRSTACHHSQWLTEFTDPNEHDAPTGVARDIR